MLVLLVSASRSPSLGFIVVGLALGDPGGTDGATVVGLLTTSAAAPKVSL